MTLDESAQRPVLSEMGAGLMGSTSDVIVRSPSTLPVTTTSDPLSAELVSSGAFSEPFDR